LALNYRMSELQGAVAVAQLSKLESIVEKRVASANRLTDKLAAIPGVEVPFVSSNSVHTYWKYCIRVNALHIPGGSVALGAKLKARQIACAPRYIQKPAFMCQVFTDRRTFGKSQFPFTLARPGILDYDPKRFPLTMQALNDIIVLPWNENYQEQHLDLIASSIEESVAELRN
jgi:perosamine synthetase